jgi:putative colanic acid biosynthesis UDP-glucose lipid carrier transferase
MPPKSLINEHLNIFVMMLRIVDLAALGLGGWLAYYYKFHGNHLVPQQSTYYYAAVACGLLTALIVLPYCKLYELDICYPAKFLTSVIDHAWLILKSCLMLILILSGAAVFTKTSIVFSRQWFMLWFGLAFSMILIMHAIVIIILLFMRSLGLYEKKIVIIGADVLGQKLAQSLQQKLWTGLRLVALFDDYPSRVASTNVLILPTPVKLSDYLHNAGIAEVWLTLALQDQDKINAVIQELRGTTITTRLILDVSALNLLNHSLSSLAEFSILTLHSSPMTGYKRLIKAIEDRVLASIILLLISPLMLVIAVAVKYSSPGPIFYCQQRLSWNGKVFKMLKFRTMPSNAESISGPVWATADEQRATGVGRFLRRTSLDELPQFINVLKGDMSIVGPRPERAVFVEQFKHKIPRYMQKHYVKAGITGWAQVNGWRGNTDLEQRIAHDIYYIENWSLWFDCKIILLTIVKGFISPHAY